MDYDAVLAQVLELLQREKRLSYRVLKRRLGVDDDELEDLKEDLIYAKKLAVDEAGHVLVWTGVAAVDRMGRVQQAHSELSTALQLYQEMEMAFWLPQVEAALAQEV